MTHYEILGLPPATDAATLRARYLELVQIHHPDKGGLEARFKDIALAWGTLKNKELRSKYDAMLHLEKKLCDGCSGKGVNPRFIRGKYRKDNPCEVCNGKGVKK